MVFNCGSCNINLLIFGYLKMQNRKKYFKNIQKLGISNNICKTWQVNINHYNSK